MNSFVFRCILGCASHGKSRVVQYSASRSRPWDQGMQVLFVGTAPLRMVLERLYRSSCASNQMETFHRTAVDEQGDHFVTLLGPV